MFEQKGFFFKKRVPIYWELGEIENQARQILHRNS